MVSFNAASPRSLSTDNNQTDPQEISEELIKSSPLTKPVWLPEESFRKKDETLLRSWLYSGTLVSRASRTPQDTSIANLHLQD